MKMTSINILHLSYIIFTLLFFSCASDNSREETVLKEHWAIQSSEKVSADGSAISKPGFQVADWYPTNIPSTILETLVKNNVVKDPYYGNNFVEAQGYFEVHAFNYLYDLPKDSPYSVPWWYRTEFELAEGDDHVWLNFSSINYKANIWLNGVLIADTIQIEGAHRLYELDITDQALQGGSNSLALEIIPPVNGTDLSIRWMQGSRMVPDKDTGIWYDVKIVRNGSLKIRYPHIITDLKLPDTTKAYVTVTAEVFNNSNEPVSGILVGNINPVDNIAEGGTSAGGTDAYDFTENIKLSPNQTKTVKVDFVMKNPDLWWPHMSGNQNLYDLHLEIKGEKNKISDTNDVRFGVREITSTLEDFFPEEDQKLVRVFQINGKNVFIKGGNWTETVMMEENLKRNEAEIQNILNLNFNAIRTEGFWGNDRFFDLCDQYGIMIFDGFNCCSIWERWDAWSDHTYEIAGLSFRDQVIRKRNHPSFVDWLLASDSHVPFRAEKLYTDIVEKYDGTRPYQSNSMYSTTPFCGCTGLDHDPYPDTYVYLHPTTWYGMKEVNEKGEFGKFEFLEFNTEIGPGAEQIPPMESMRAMMPKEDLWPINKTWEVRQSSDEFSVNATNAFNLRYGKPTDLESYTVKAQVFQKESYRSMVEAFRKNKYMASGILIYRLNAGWPSLSYFLYDYNLRPNGAYAGTQQGYEPLHVFYAYDDNSVVVANDLYRDFKNLKVSAKILNLDMTEKYSFTDQIDVDEDAVKSVVQVPEINGLSQTYFLDLKLENEHGDLLSSNFYWLSTQNDEDADFSNLMTLPVVKLTASAAYEEKGVNSRVKVKITNPLDQLAFFINPKIQKGLHGEELLPTYWSTKYFSILPGKSREIDVTFDVADLDGSEPYLMLEGWNIDPLEIALNETNEEVTPSLSYADITVPKSVKPGQAFNISLTVINTANSGVALLKSRQHLHIDDQPVSYKRVALAPGESKKLSWASMKINEKGSYTIKIGDMEAVNIEVK